jgi:DNA-binding FadR family transcriptional regulator
MIPLEPKRPKAAEIVAAELRRQIVAGELKPGDKLHAEHVLRTRFAISRPTLREALRLLEAESLIVIRRGQQGGARVKAMDLAVAARQVGVHLQIEGATLEDVWHARLVIEPAAAALLAAARPPAAIAELEANILEARDAAEFDPIRYGELSAEFSSIIARHCGNRTLHLFAALIYQIIRRQHAHVISKTLSKPGIEKLRRESVSSRERLLTLVRTGDSAAVQAYWFAQLQHMRALMLAAYRGLTTLDVLDEPVGRIAPVRNIKRPGPRRRASVRAA